MRPTRPSKLARRLRASAYGVLLAGGALGAAVSLEACSGDGDATGGRRIVVRTRLEIDPEAKEAFSNSFGWRVQLDGALLSVGPLYYFDGAPAVVSRAVPRWLGVGVAHAHPGHYQPGDALGEVLASANVDLWKAPLELADGDGVTGTYRSARFSFVAPAEGALSKELGGHVAVASGSATKEGEETRYFRATATLASVEKSAAEGHVEGCEFREVEVESDGTVTLLVRPTVWFELVDFAQTEPGSAEALVDFPEGSQPAVAFAQGLAQLSAYRFSYRAD